MAITKFKFGFISAMVIAGVAIFLIIQHQGQIRLQRENQALMQQAARLQDENESLSNQLVSANSAQLLSKEQLSELLRLRGEAGRLRQQLKQLDQARLESQRLRGQLSASEPSPPTTPTTISVPFQIRLVVDAGDQNAETVTNRATIADTNAAPETLYVQKTSLIDATAIQSADMVTDPLGNPQIDIVLTEQGRELFAKATRENLNKRLAIIMGGQSYLAPTVRDEITGGKIQLSGSFTEQQGRELAAKINEAISRR